MSTEALVKTSVAGVQSPGSGELALQLIQLVGGLALVLGLIFALAWLAKRRVVFSRHSQMGLVERLSLGPKENLFLVRVGNETLLVGASAGSVTLLKTLAPELQSTPEKDNSTAVDPGFAAQLARVLGH